MKGEKGVGNLQKVKWVLSYLKYIQKIGSCKEQEHMELCVGRLGRNELDNRLRKHVKMGEKMIL